MCDENIHKAFYEMDEIMCQICFKLLVDYKNIEPKQDLCCDNPNLQSQSGQVVCVNCGQID